LSDVATGSLVEGDWQVYTLQPSPGVVYFFLSFQLIRVVDPHAESVAEALGLQTNTVGGGGPNHRVFALVGIKLDIVLVPEVYIVKFLGQLKWLIEVVRNLLRIYLAALVAALPLLRQVASADVTTAEIAGVIHLVHLDATLR